MSRPPKTAPAKPVNPTPEAVAAPTEAVAAPEVATAADAPAVDVAALEAISVAGGVASFDTSDEDPAEPAMPEPPKDEPKDEPKGDEPALRTDGPTPSEYVEAGYSMDTYPPRGYAAKTDADPRSDAHVVRYFKTLEYCRYVNNGVIVTWPKGMVIDSLNFDMVDVRAQGIPLVPATAADIDTTPAVGHRSV